MDVELIANERQPVEAGYQLSLCTPARAGFPRRPAPATSALVTCFLCARTLTQYVEPKYLPLFTAFFRGEEVLSTQVVDVGRGDDSDPDKHSCLSPPLPFSLFPIQ